MTPQTSQIPAAICDVLDCIPRATIEAYLTERKAKEIEAQQP